MPINKYSLEDTVFFMNANRCRSGEIVGVNINTLLDCDDTIIYRIKFTDKEFLINMKEDMLFPTKEELIKTL